MISNIVNLLGQQQYVRDTGLGWTFGLLGLLGLIAVPIVILIYLIKSKYVPKTVSSTFIWKRSLKYMKRRIPINFIMSLLLIVQLLTVAVATMALMDVRVEDERGADKIIVIDASASMTLDREVIQTTATGTQKTVIGTRYDYALSKVQELTADIGEESGVCIIFAGDSPQLLTKSKPEEDEGNEREVPYIYDPARMENVMEALKKKTCSTKATDLNKALSLASEAIDTSPEAQIYLITDRERSGFLLDENASIEIIACNDIENDRNIGIVGFKESKSDVSYSFNVSLEAQGRNQSYMVDVIFELDGVEMDRKKETLSTDSSTNVPRTKTITFGPIKVQEYERARVRIEVEGDIIDYDNEAYLYYVPEQELNILYVSNLLKYKEETNKVDLSSNKRPVLLDRLHASGYSLPQENVFHADNIKKAPTSGYDLYIYEGVVPEKAPTDGAIWYINATGTPTGVDGLIISKDPVDGVNHVVDEPALQGEYAKQILKNVDFNKEGAVFASTVNEFYLINHNIDENGFPVFDVPAGFDVILEAYYEATNEKGEKKEVAAPILLAGTVGTTRVIVSTFKIAYNNTLLPLDFANFEPMKINMLAFSAPDILPNRTPFIGEKLEFNPPSGIESIKYVYFTPEQEVGRYENEKGTGAQEYLWSKKDGELLPSITLNKFGLYEMQVTYEPTYSIDEFGSIVENPRQTEIFSVYTRAVDSEVSLENNTLQELVVPAQGQTEAEPFVRHTSILPWVVLALIVLLIIEWGVYYRDEY